MIPRIAVCVALMAAAALCQDPGTFRALDVFVDGGDAGVAAYQIEIVPSGKSEIVSVEGGEPAAFHEAPFYDPAAMQGGKLIIAAYTLESVPVTGRVRIARIHVLEKGAVEYHVRLMTAASSAGDRVRIPVELKGGSR